MKIISIILSLACLLLTCSCAAQIPQSWELSDIEMSFTEPDAAPEVARIKHNGKYCENDTGKFYMDSADEKVCNEFISAQTELLDYLVRKGTPVEKPDPMRFYLSEYNRNNHQTKTLQSGENSTVYYAVGYFDYSSVKTYEQVMTTLELVYDEYIDYGYLYWLSNAIAKELKWQTDEVEQFSEAELADYAKNNPLYMQLTYPCFVDEYCFNTAEYAKALSLHVYEKAKPSDCLSMPLEEQTEAYRDAVKKYADSIGVEYTEAEFQFLYRSDQFPISIITPLFDIHLSKNYEDACIDDYGQDFFDDYAEIIETTNYILADFYDCLDRYSVTDKAEKIDIFFHNTEEFNEAIVATLGSHGAYRGGALQMRSINNIVHEYCHYIQRLLDAQLTDVTYEGQVFPEWNNYNSHFCLLFYNAREGEWFKEQTGRELKTRDDMLEFADMCSVLADSWIIDAYSNATTMSFANYIADKYGEDIMIDIFLHPNTKFDEYGIDVEALQAEWKAAMLEKYGWLSELRESTLAGNS